VLYVTVAYVVQVFLVTVTKCYSIRDNWLVDSDSSFDTHWLTVNSLVDSDTQWLTVTLIG